MMIYTREDRREQTKTLVIILFFNFFISDLTCEQVYFQVLTVAGVIGTTHKDASPSFSYIALYHICNVFNYLIPMLKAEKYCTIVTTHVIGASLSEPHTSKSLVRWSRIRQITIKIGTYKITIVPLVWLVRSVTHHTVS